MYSFIFIFLTYIFTVFVFYFVIRSFFTHSFIKTYPDTFITQFKKKSTWVSFFWGRSWWRCRRGHGPRWSWPCTWRWTPQKTCRNPRRCPRTVSCAAFELFRSKQGSAFTKIFYKELDVFSKEVLVRFAVGVFAAKCV